MQIMQMTLGNLRQKEVSGASTELKELQNLWTSVALETSEDGAGGTSLGVPPPVNLDSKQPPVSVAFVQFQVPTERM